MKTYKEKLNDPRWKQRVVDFKESYSTNPSNPFDKCEIACLGCGSINNIEVHHKKYINGLEPWEYKDIDLSVLCRGCHQQYHNNKKILVDFLSNNRLFYSHEFSEVIKIIKSICEMETNDISEIKNMCINIVKSKSYDCNK